MRIVEFVIAFSYTSHKKHNKSILRFLYDLELAKAIDD